MMRSSTPLKKDISATAVLMTQPGAQYCIEKNETKKFQVEVDRV
ncbi:MAG: hypothetical protein RR588_12660 [Solibacillus sp.]